MMKNASERRELSFTSLDEIVADVERLAGGKTRTTGNHTFGQIVEHLAITLDAVVGTTVPPRPQLIVRLIMPFAKHFILRGPAQPGFKLPKDAESFFWPQGDVDLHQSIAHLKAAVETYKTKGPLVIHPVFGKLSPEKNFKLQCDHSAMHLSFVHPGF
jgi:hypothetical protein